MNFYVPKVQARSRAQIESFAERLTQRYYPELLIQPGKFPALPFFEYILPEDYGLDTGVAQLSPGVEGITWPDGRVFLSEATYANAEAGEGRARFTVCHEICHGLYHRQEIDKALVDTGELVLHRRSDIRPFEDPEWQADTFSSALLMPATMVRLAVYSIPANQRIRVVSGTFQVSPKAAEVRLKKLQLLIAI